MTSVDHLDGLRIVLRQSGREVVAFDNHRAGNPEGRGVPFGEVGNIEVDEVGLDARRLAVVATGRLAVAERPIVLERLRPHERHLHPLQPKRGAVDEPEAAGAGAIAAAAAAEPVAAAAQPAALPVLLGPALPGSSAAVTTAAAPAATTTAPAAAAPPPLPNPPPPSPPSPPPPPTAPPPQAPASC